MAKEKQGTRFSPELLDALLDGQDRIKGRRHVPRQGGRRGPLAMEGTPVIAGAVRSARLPALGLFCVDPSS